MSVFFLEREREGKGETEGQIHRYLLSIMWLYMFQTITSASSTQQLD